MGTSRKKENDNWLDRVSEDYDYETKGSEHLSEDSEFPALVSKKEDAKNSLYSDVERKRAEIDNSTVGGF